MLIIEREGPRPQFRRKLKRKLAGWDGPPIGDRIKVKAAPWATFSLADEAWRQWLAEVVEEHQFDVVVAGPLTRIGMDGAGTLQEVAAFMDLIGEVRSRCSRRFATVVPHHEGKSGSVSGGWEGAPETLLHVQAAGHGRTVVFVQKARWGASCKVRRSRLPGRPARRSRSRATVTTSQR